MPLTLDLPPELESHLKEEAARRGILPEQIAVTALTDHMLAARKRVHAAALFEHWKKKLIEDTERDRDGDLEVLRAIDAGRAGYRQLFTEVLEEADDEKIVVLDSSVIGMLITRADKPNRTLARLD